MATKIVAGVVVILALAAAGTVGVAYYNDPTIFDATNGCSRCSMQKQTEPATQQSSDPMSTCCDPSEPTAEKSCCESKP